MAMGRNVSPTFHTALLLVVISAFTVHAKDVCADSTCFCHREDDDFIVSCSDLNVAYFEDTIRRVPYDVTELEIIHSQWQGEYMEIKNGTFKELGKLTKLNLQDSHVMDIDADAFSGLGRLKSLRLSSNQLSMRSISSVSGIHPGSFRSLKELSALYLDKNIDLMTLPDDLCRTCNSLNNLDVSYNNIYDLNKTLQACKYLIELDLSYNQFSHFSRDTFRGLENLRILDISGNPDAQLSSDVFTDVPGVSDLSMGGIRRGVPRNILAPLTQLRLLDVAGIGLNCIDTSCTYGLDMTPVAGGLRVLNLTRNALWMLAGGTFKAFVTLRSLSLDEMGFRYKENTFDGLNELRILSMDDNPFGISVPLAALLPKLETLSCVGCTTNSTMLSSVLKGMPNLVSLNLDDNGLTLVTPDSFRGIPKAKISVKDNPWKCNCSLFPVQEWLKQREIAIDIICVYPEKLTGKNLRNLRPRDFDGCTRPVIRGCCNEEILTSYGTNLTLHCRVDGLPKATIEYKQPDGSLVPGDRSSISNDGQSITVNYVTEDDTGVFTCDASNVLGMSTMYYDIKVTARKDCPLPFGCDCQEQSVTCPWLPYDLVPRTFLNIPSDTEKMDFIGDLRELSYDYFTDIPWLTRIILASCNISSMTEDTFYGLNSLRVISLAHNKLSELPANIFSGLKKLTRVNLSHNEITQISNGGLSECPNLQILDLSSNRIETLQSGSFEGLEALISLSLSGNRIRSLSAETFLGLSNLHLLRLANNSNIMINEYPFSHLENLIELDMQNVSKSGSFERTIFHGLTSLESLHMGYNRQQCIHCLDWTPVAEKLRLLKLDGNNIETIRTGTFSKFTSLTELSIRNSSVKTIEPGSFEGLNSLKALSLAENHLHTIDVELLKGLHSLKTLELFSSRVKSIQESAFANQKNMTAVYIQDNELSILPGGVFEDVPRSVEINLQGNPWRCNCSMYDFKHWLRRSKMDLDIVCQDPVAYKVSLLDLADDHLDGCKEPGIEDCCIEIIEKSAGDNISMECKATGVPKPTISYHVISGDPLPSRTVFSHDNRTALVSNAFKENSGIFVCKVTNFKGMLEFVFDVKIGSGPVPTEGRFLWSGTLVGVLFGIVGLFSLLIAIGLFFRMKRAHNQYYRMASEPVDL